MHFSQSDIATEVMPRFAKLEEESERFFLFGSSAAAAAFEESDDLVDALVDHGILSRDLEPVLIVEISLTVEAPF